MAFKKLKYWFDKELALLLANKLLEVNSKFAADQFVHNISSRIDSLELKDRVEIFSDQLFSIHDEDYIKGLNNLMQILGPENEEETGMFNNFYWIMPIAKYIEKYGLEYFEESMYGIEEVTKRNTGEYAIRPYLQSQTSLALAQMMSWSKNNNRHVRRLSSEGVRPRLPWAAKLDLFINDPTPLFPILNNLKDDPSKYVQKSVANCLNDILKDNLDLGKDWIEQWSTKDPTPERLWIIKHALRRLIKSEDEWALKIIGR